MRMSKPLWTALLIVLAAAAFRPALLLVFPQPTAASTATLTAKVVEAANAFLATLSAAERAKCTFSFNSTQRTGWSNLPTGIFQRNGLRFGDMTPRQRAGGPGAGRRGVEP